MTRALVTLPVSFWLLAIAGCGKHASSDRSTQPTAAQTISIDAGGIPMVLVPGGQFEMGRNDGPPGEGPAHIVRLTAFAIDRFEITQDQFARLELPNPSKFKDPRRPTDQVRWTEAAVFCNERSLLEGLQPCYDPTTFACDFEASGYRLPTEAEWEYAARAGGLDDRLLDASPQALERLACFAANSGERTALVGERRANSWDIHDMMGNVAEWCNDIYTQAYASSEPQQDPRGPTEGKLRVLRGGSWKSPAAQVGLTCRQGDIPGIVDACVAKSTYGFRCVRRLTDEERTRQKQLLAPTADSNR